MAILDYDEAIWREALGIAPGEEPAALILEGTWWRDTATKTRLAELDETLLTAALIGLEIGANTMLGAGLAVLAETITRIPASTVLITDGRPVAHHAFVGAHRSTATQPNHCQGQKNTQPFSAHVESLLVSRPESAPVIKPDT